MALCVVMCLITVSVRDVSDHFVSDVSDRFVNDVSDRFFIDVSDHFVSDVSNRFVSDVAGCFVSPTTLPAYVITYAFVPLNKMLREMEWST